MEEFIIAEAMKREDYKNFSQVLQGFENVDDAIQSIAVLTEKMLPILDKVLACDHDDEIITSVVKSILMFALTHDTDEIKKCFDIGCDSTNIFDYLQDNYGFNPDQVFAGLECLAITLEYQYAWAINPVKKNNPYFDEIVALLSYAADRKFFACTA